MAKSILLLVERRAGGKGPVIPIRNMVSKVCVMGLGDNDYVGLAINSGERDMLIGYNGIHELPNAVAAGSFMRAELLGDNSVATVWVE